MPKSSPLLGGMHQNNARRATRKKVGPCDAWLVGQRSLVLSNQHLIHDFWPQKLLPTESSQQISKDEPTTSCTVTDALILTPTLDFSEPAHPTSIVSPTSYHSGYPLAH